MLRRLILRRLRWVLPLMAALPQTCPPPLAAVRPCWHPHLPQHRHACVRAGLCRTSKAACCPGQHTAEAASSLTVTALSVERSTPSQYHAEHQEGANLQLPVCCHGHRQLAALVLHFGHHTILVQVCLPVRQRLLEHSTLVPLQSPWQASLLTATACHAELFQLQESDADYQLLPGEAPSSPWPAVAHDVCACPLAQLLPMHLSAGGSSVWQLHAWH